MLRWLDHRRGVYTGITEHRFEVLNQAAPVYEAALRDGFAQAELDPKLVDLLGAIRGTGA